MTVKKQFHIVQLSTLLLRKKGVKVILFKKKILFASTLFISLNSTIYSLV